MGNVQAQQRSRDEEIGRRPHGRERDGKARESERQLRRRDRLNHQRLQRSRQLLLANPGSEARARSGDDSGKSQADGRKIEVRRRPAERRSLHPREGAGHEIGDEQVEDGEEKIERKCQPVRPLDHEVATDERE